MHTARNVGLVVIALIVVAVVAGYLFFRNNALAADRAPGRIETAVARRLVWLSIPTSQRARTNPLAEDADAWHHAADHFGDHCATCHGMDGRGHSEIGSRMYPPAPDLSTQTVQKMSDGELFAIIQNGVRWTGMPAFRQEHSDDDTWALVSFVRHVPSLPLQPDADSDEAHEHLH